MPNTLMTDLIAISLLNDYIFCPYSIYLHNVYMESDTDVYHATPQVVGRNAHEVVDTKRATNAHILEALPVISHELGIFGKIDVYRKDTKTLTERKYNLKQIFQGQIYQLWAQYFCLTEMGYQVERLCFYEISTRKTTPMPLPTASDKQQLQEFLSRFRTYDPHAPFSPNPNKCLHCVYCNLCDKTLDDNVF